jgi:hypothetical protein
MILSLRRRTAAFSALFLVISSVMGASSAFAAAPAPLPVRPGGAPKNVTVTSVKATAQIQWSSGSTNQDGFRVARWDNTARKWVFLGNTGATATTFTDPAPIAGRTYYHVCAFNTVADRCSNGVPFGYDHPDSPTGLAGSVVSGAVQLSWANGSAPQDGVRVYRWDRVGKTWARLASTAANVTAYTDSTPLAGRQNYHVCSFNTKSEWCSGVTGAGFEHPESPASLVGTLVSSTVQLAWSNGQAPQDGVRVYRWDVPGKKWARIASTTASATAFTDPSPGSGRQNYHVCAFNANGEWCSIGTSVGAERPDAPSGLTSTLASGSVQLSWTNGKVAQDGVRVYRWDTVGKAWARIGTTAAAATTSTDAAPGVGRQHYHVCAFDARTESCSTITGVGSDEPTAPSGLVGTRTGNSVQLSWTVAASGQTGVHVARWDRTKHSWVQMASLAASATTYTDTTAVGRQYYHVSAFNTKGERYSTVLGVS